ncbi:hypothetical protein ACVIGB_000165 [Bradyrhizobium sp. USDA 4341]
MSALSLSPLRARSVSRPQPLRATLSQSSKSVFRRDGFDVRIRNASVGYSPSGYRLRYGRKQDAQPALAKANWRSTFAVGGARLAPRAQTGHAGQRRHRAPFAGLRCPTIVGIDDWAWRRGRRYGTTALAEVVLAGEPRSSPAIVRDFMLMAHAAAHPTRSRSGPRPHTRQVTVAVQIMASAHEVQFRAAARRLHKCWVDRKAARRERLSLDLEPVRTGSRNAVRIAATASRFVAIAPTLGGGDQGGTHGTAKVREFRTTATRLELFRGAKSITRDQFELEQKNAVQRPEGWGVVMKSHARGQ